MLDCAPDVFRLSAAVGSSDESGKCSTASPRRSPSNEICASPASSSIKTSNKPLLSSTFQKLNGAFHSQQVHDVIIANFLGSNYRAGKKLPMFVIWIVVGCWKQPEKAVADDDTLSGSGAVCAFIEQPNMYLHYGIFFRHLRVPLQYDTANLESQIATAKARWPGLEPRRRILMQPFVPLELRRQAI